MRRKDVQNKTREILRTEPYSRENDGYLIRRVIEELEPDLYKKGFETIMNNLQFTGISIESITRERRRFFKENPELKVAKTEKARREKEQEYYLEYSRHTPRID